MTQSISIYNDELKKFKEKPINIKKSKADDFIDFSKNMITWTAEIKRDIEREKNIGLKKIVLDYRYIDLLLNNIFISIKVGIVGNIKYQNYSQIPE